MKKYIFSVDMWDEESVILAEKDIEVPWPKDNVPTPYSIVMRKALDMAIEEAEAKNMKVMNIEYKGVIYLEEG